VKLLNVVKKSCKEQLRSIWIFILTVSMAPIFILIYYLMLETSIPHYEVLVFNQDIGITAEDQNINHGDRLLASVKQIAAADPDIPLTISSAPGREEGVAEINNRKADALIVIPENFSQSIQQRSGADLPQNIKVEFVGDITNFDYMLSAVWANEILTDYVHRVSHSPRLLSITETSLGRSGSANDFDLYIPGLLILAIIMLMFSAAIAFVTEVENKTMIRVKLSRVSTLEYLTGVSLVQIVVGIISLLLTLFMAVALGFNYSGAFSLVLLIAVLTGVSIVAFSLIVAAVTKTANEVLILGNFPLFLFMFFSGAAFPIHGKELFAVAGYPITLQGLMSASHSVSALKKVLILNMGLADIIPELVVLLCLTVVYFLIGGWAFKRRHMKVI